MGDFDGVQSVLSLVSILPPSLDRTLVSVNWLCIACGNLHSQLLALSGLRLTNEDSTDVWDMWWTTPVNIGDMVTVSSRNLVGS